MLKVKLTQENSSRTEPLFGEAFVIGKITNVPEVGERFRLFKLNGKGEQLITTAVQSVEYMADSREFLFRTKNSTYKVTSLEPEKDPMDYASWRSKR